jgi:hypothetical protein
MQSHLLKGGGALHIMKTLLSKHVIRRGEQKTWKTRLSYFLGEKINLYFLFDSEVSGITFYAGKK